MVEQLTNLAKLFSVVFPKLVMGALVILVNYACLADIYDQSRTYFRIVCQDVVI